MGGEFREFGEEAFASLLSLPKLPKLIKFPNPAIPISICSKMFN